MSTRETLAKALEGHKYDTLSQDSGMQCTCGSDSRFEQRGGDMPWSTFTEHLADVALRALDRPDEASCLARLRHRIAARARYLERTAARQSAAAERAWKMSGYGKNDVWDNHPGQDSLELSRHSGDVKRIAEELRLVLTPSENDMYPEVRWPRLKRMYTRVVWKP